MRSSPMRKRLDRYGKLLDLASDEGVLDALDALVRTLLQTGRVMARPTVRSGLLRPSPRRRHPLHHR
jgi:hypothetical protein